MSNTRIMLMSLKALFVSFQIILCEETEEWCLALPQMQENYMQNIHKLESGKFD